MSLEDVIYMNHAIMTCLFITLELLAQIIVTIMVSAEMNDVSALKDIMVLSLIIPRIYFFLNR